MLFKKGGQWPHRTAATRAVKMDLRLSNLRTETNLHPCPSLILKISHGEQFRSNPSLPIDLRGFIANGTLIEIT